MSGPEKQLRVLFVALQYVVFYDLSEHLPEIEKKRTLKIKSLHMK
jgi:hypothetical protein